VSIRADVIAQSFIKNLRVVASIADFSILRITLLTLIYIRAFDADTSMFDIPIRTGVDTRIIIEKQFRSHAVKAFITICTFLTVGVTFFTFIEHYVEVVSRPTFSDTLIIFEHS